MSRLKKAVRVDFKRLCLERDQRACRLCGIKAGEHYEPLKHCVVGAATLTAHHITDRSAMPNGGYVASNGITLCEACHLDVEDVARGDSEGVSHLAPERIAQYASSSLYQLIGSSYEQALRDSEAA